MPPSDWEADARKLADERLWTADLAGMITLAVAALFGTAIVWTSVAGWETTQGRPLSAVVTRWVLVALAEGYALRAESRE